MRRACAFAVLVVLVAACSSTTSSAIDGGCLVTDGGYEAGDAGFLLTPMNPPHQPEHACTTQQLSDYAQCQGAKNQSLCKQFEAGGSSTACSACMESKASDATWGVVVFDQQAASFNVEGCVDLALGQTATEKANGGAGSCGDLLHASYECQNEADAALCNACAGDASDCQQTVLVTACADQNSAVLDASGPCASLFSDAAPAAALACFPSTSITDPELQEVDWLMRVGAVFCGP